MKKFLSVALAAGSFLLAPDVCALPPNTAVVANFSLNLSPGVVRQFMTAYSDEANSLRPGGIHSDWKWIERSDSFLAWTTQVPGTVPVSRFFTTEKWGQPSHFYTADAAEAAKVQKELSDDWILEDSHAFYVELPEFDAVTGEEWCKTGRQPIFRFYNNGNGGVPNHAYTASWKKRDEFAASSSYWVFESIAFCVPAVTDKVMVANHAGTVVQLVCVMNLTTFNVAALTSNDLCTLGNSATVAPVYKKSDVALLSLSDTPLKIDIEKNAVLTPYRNNGTFNWIAIDNLRGKIYGVRSPSPLSGTTDSDVVEIDEKGIVQRVLQGGINGFAPAHLTLVGKYLFVLHVRYDQNLSVNTDWLTITDSETGNLVKQIPVPMNPHGGAYDPKRGIYYAAGIGELPSTQRYSALLAIDVRTAIDPEATTVVTDLGFPVKRPYGLFVDTSTDELWVASQDYTTNFTLMVYDLNRGTWDSIPTGYNLTYLEMVFTASGEKELWASYWQAHTGPDNWKVGRLDPARRLVLSVFPSQPAPYGITSCFMGDSD